MSAETTPAAGGCPARTMGALFFAAAARFETHRALDDPRSKPPVTMTYGELAADVRAMAAGLARLGVKRGDRVALFADNRPRWLVADMALLAIGAVECPRGCDTTTPEFEFILKHSGCTAAIVQDARLFERLAGSESLAALKFIVLVEDGADTAPTAIGGPRLINFSALLDDGRAHPGAFDDAAAAVRTDDLAAIVYTSGTTGSPKGVMLTHANFVSQGENIDFGSLMGPGTIVLSILPTWHAYERAVEYYVLGQGVTIVYTDKRRLRDDLSTRVRPHIFPCVPRIWETIYEAIHDKVAKAPPARQKLFAFFTAVGARHVKARRLATGRDLRTAPRPAAARAAAWAITVALAPVAWLGDRLVFSKLRAAVTGGRMGAAVSGGGSFAVYLDDFFEVCGIPLLNGYGLTETSPVLSVRLTHRNVRGTVGPLIKGTRVSIRDDQGHELPAGKPGIIHVAGPQVMIGYYNNPEATAKVLSHDGWLNTGDIGYVAATGELAITGRAKDTIVLAGGENVEPEPIENVARRSPLVAQIVVVGQDRKSVAALVVPNIAAAAAAAGLPADTTAATLCADPKAAKAVQTAIAAAMKSDGGFKSIESLSKIALLAEPFSEENGLLTQTLKIKRAQVTDRYAAIIESLFA